MFVCLLIINCHSVVTGVWSLPATGSHPNAWLPVLSPPYSSGHRPPSLATPSPKRTLSLTPHPPPPPLRPKCVFLSPLHISTHPANPIFHLLTSNTPVSPPLLFSLLPHAPFLLKWLSSPVLPPIPLSLLPPQGPVPPADPSKVKAATSEKKKQESRKDKK